MLTGTSPSASHFPIAPRVLSPSPGPFANIIADMQDQTIELVSSSGSISIVNCRRCTIKLGACRGAAYVENVSDSVIVLASHQLRLSECHRVRLSCHVETNVLLENSSEITVEVLDPAWYSVIASSMVVAGLLGPNNYRAVVDLSSSPPLK
jgi:hypothetical protein